MASLADLNQMDDDACSAMLTRCCGSSRWVAQMLALRPFTSEEALLADASRIWAALSREDYLEAFSHHPQIGKTDTVPETAESTTEWASAEQAATRTAPSTTLERLAQLNQEYVERFGYIFIICASGKSAESMLAALENRLTHAAEQELHVAANEQLQITVLRLEKLLHETD